MGKSDFQKYGSIRERLIIWITDPWIVEVDANQRNSYPNNAESFLRSKQSRTTVAAYQELLLECGTPAHALRGAFMQHLRLPGAQNGSLSGTRASIYVYIYMRVTASRRRSKRYRRSCVAFLFLCATNQMTPGNRSHSVQSKRLWLGTSAKTGINT